MFFKNKLLRHIDKRIADCEQLIKEMESRINPETETYYHDWITDLKGGINELNNLKMDIIFGKI